MGIQNALILEETSIAMSETSSEFEMEKYSMGSVTAKITGDNPSNVTFDTGTMDVKTVTWTAVSQESVKTLTFPTKAGAANGDYIVVYDAAGVSYGVALVKPVAEVQLLTFPSVAGSTGGDYVVLTDGAGLTWAISLNKSGADAEPTGAAWVAVNAARKVHVNISGGTDAASVAALVETAFDALTGASAIVTDDSAADGTMTLTMATKAPCADPVPHDAADGGAGSILGVEVTPGVASQTPTGAVWTAATYKGLADISSDTTAANVAARAETALNLLTGFTAAITSDDTAADGTMTLTSLVHGAVASSVPKTFNDGAAGSISSVDTSAYAGPTDGDYIAFYDQAGNRWAAAVDLQGTQASTPTGAIWTAISASRKTEVDISGVSTAAAIAAAFETAIDAMTGLTAVITTDDSAANGTMLFTQVIPGTVSAAVPKSFDDVGAGSITVANTTPGVATEVSPSGNTVTIPSHGLLTGVKITELTTTGTLPAGLSTSTVYYAIVVDTDTIKFATSQANALAGTAVDITGYGATTSVNTLSIATALAGTIKLQVDVEPSSGTANWVDLSDEEVLNGNNSQTYSAAGNMRWVLPDILFRAVRAVVTATSGTVLVEIRAYLKAIRS